MPNSTRRLAWPGNDKNRADGAAFHLIHACRALIVAETSLLARLFALDAARVHVRIARGYLGAIGFENGTRL